MDEDRTNTETGDNTENTGENTIVTDNTDKTEEDEHIENLASTADESLETATEPQPTGTGLHTKD